MGNSASQFDVDTTLSWEGIHDAIVALGLERNILELECDGITTITPEQSGVTPGFISKVRKELIRLCGEITDREFLEERGPDQAIPELEPRNTFLIFQLLAYRIPEFEEVMLNPALQTLMGYLLGPERRLSSLSGFIKWQSSEPPEGNRFEPYGLHTDTPLKSTLPLAPLQVANSNFLLTDFATWDDGPMVVAKGSHKEGRHPLESDAVKMGGYYAPAGSFVVFGGCLQHGSISRLNPGMRISINGYFCQPYIVPQECLQGEFKDVAAKGKLASQLVWQDASNGWGVQGPAFMPTPFTKKTSPSSGYGYLPKHQHPNSKLTQG